MKIKLFGNATMEPLALALLNGGYDPESGRVTLVVKNDDYSGLLTMDVGEARRIADILSTSTPAVERVEAIHGQKA